MSLWMNHLFSVTLMLLLFWSSSLVIDGQMISLVLNPLKLVNGSELCVTDLASETFSSRSKLDCIRTCAYRTNPICNGVNYRTTDRQCGFYHYKPKNYEVRSYCTHFEVRFENILCKIYLRKILLNLYKKVGYMFLLVWWYITRYWNNLVSVITWGWWTGREEIRLPGNIK